MASESSSLAEKYNGASPICTTPSADTKSTGVSAKLVAKSIDRPCVVSGSTTSQITKNSSKNCCIYYKLASFLVVVIIVLLLILNVYTLISFFKLQSEFEKLKVLFVQEKQGRNIVQNDRESNVVFKQSFTSKSMQETHISTDRQKGWLDESQHLNTFDAYRADQTDGNHLLRKKREDMNGERNRRRQERRKKPRPTSPITTKSKRSAENEEQGGVSHEKRHDHGGSKRPNNRDRPARKRDRRNRGEQDRAIGHYTPGDNFQHTHGDDGHYTDWVRTQWSSDLSVKYIPLQGGKAKIEDNGVYLIYAQVTFNDPSRNRVGFAIERTNEAGGNKKTLAKCIQTFPTIDVLSVHSCYTSLAYPLTSGDLVYIENSYDSQAADNESTTVHQHPEMTFWGLIKLH